MRYQEHYQTWLTGGYFDEATKQELLAIKDNEKEIEDRFYRDLEFGTGGMRGVIGAGTNRMNRYTVRKATQGLANYVKKQPARLKRASLLPMIPAIAPGSSLWRQPLFWQQTRLEPIC
jgi:phosphoglucomutase